MNIKPYRFPRDINGYADILAYPPPDFVYDIEIEDIDTPEQFTVPSDFPKYIIQFEPLTLSNIDFYVNFDAPAFFLPTVPAVIQSTQITNPFRVEVKAGTVVSVATGVGSVIYGAYLYGLRY